MIKLRYWLVWVAAAFAVGCSCVDRKSVQGLSTSGDAIICEEEQPLDTTALLTYWNGHDFATLDSFEDIRSTEDKFDGFVSLLSKAPHDMAVEEMYHFLDSAAQNVVAYMVWSGWFEPYLHAKESPYCNDDLFVAWLDKVLADKVIDDGSQMEHLAMMRKCMAVNRAGMTPQDIQVFAEDGSECMLSDFSGKRTLLLFVDADCPSCLDGLKVNAEEYKGSDVNLLAVLANGSTYHLSNIRKKLPSEVLANWTFVYRSASKLQNDGLYDTSLLPFRILVSPDWLIEKSYF